MPQTKELMDYWKLVGHADQATAWENWLFEIMPGILEAVAVTKDRKRWLPTFYSAFCISC